MQQQRRLAAILFTDIVGSTAVMQKDEQVALSLNKRYVAVLKQCVTAAGGEVLNDYGDGSLCTFHSATDALHCAINIQQQLQQEPKVPLRIGLHVGEIFFDDGKVFGDGVNVASRVQSLGIANSVLFSSEIYNKIKNQQEFKSVSLGKFHFKNVDELVEVFALANDGFAVPDKKKIDGKLHEKKKNKKFALIAGIAVILALLIVFYFKKSYGFTGKERSIAILPFSVAGNNEDNLASGLVEDILVHLSKIKEFDKVISSKSSSQYRNTKKDIKEIGEELGAVFLVTGSIQEDNDKIRVSAQLIDSRDGKTIWADNYTKQNVEIFDLETELATQIVSALKTEITPEEKTGLSKRYTDNVEAYKLYQKGVFFWNKNTQSDFDSAEVYYKQALDIDPEYALAYSGLADCYIFSRKISNQLEGIPIAKIYTQKALSIDSNLSESLTTLGWIQGVFDYDWAKSKITLEKAIKLNPNYGGAHLFYGNLLQYTGESKERGINEVKRALELDPLNARFNWVLARNYYLARQYDLALAQSKKTLILNPNFFLVKWVMVYVYLEKKMFPEAFELIKQLPKVPATNSVSQGPYLAYAYAVSGDTARGRVELEKTMQEYPNQSQHLLAYVYVALKDYDGALDKLEQAYNQRDIDLYWLKIDPIFDPIKNEPRFKALLKKMNLE